MSGDIFQKSKIKANVPAGTIMVVQLFQNFVAVCHGGGFCLMGPGAIAFAWLLEKQGTWSVDDGRCGIPF